MSLLRYRSLDEEVKYLVKDVIRDELEERLLKLEQKLEDVQIEKKLQDIELLHVKVQDLEKSVEKLDDKVEQVTKAKEVHEEIYHSGGFEAVKSTNIIHAKT